MTNWDDFQPDDDQKKWSKWTMKPSKRSSPLTNFMSAFLLTLATIVVMAGHST